MIGRLPLTELRAALAQGEAVVVLIETGADIEDARNEGRSACAQLVAGLGIDGLHLSRSATTGLAAVALCRSGPVGVDVERVRSDWVDEDLLQLALHPNERAALRGMGDAAFFGIWVRKEAVLKALGVGLAVPPNALAVGDFNMGWTGCAVQAVPVGGVVSVRSLAAPIGVCAAVACVGSATGLRNWTLPFARRHSSGAVAGAANAPLTASTACFWMRPLIQGDERHKSIPGPETV